MGDRKLKVYAGTHAPRGRAIVAAQSKAELARIIGGKGATNYAREWWSETGNAVEIAAALARPRQKLIVVDGYGNELLPLGPSEKCSECGGKGWSNDGRGPMNCAHCHGFGIVRA